MRGIYLSEPHGKLIWDGGKTAVAKSRPRDDLTGGPWAVVSRAGPQALAFGTVTLGAAEPVPATDFDQRFGEHRVSRNERTRWWPEADTLYLHPIEEFERFPEPRTVAIMPGTQTIIDEVAFIDAKEAPMPYDKNDDLPEPVRKVLPAAAQDIYRGAHNGALREYKGDEQRAAQVAWAAVKKAGWHKNDAGEWVQDKARAEDEAEDQPDSESPASDSKGRFQGWRDKALALVSDLKALLTDEDIPPARARDTVSAFKTFAAANGQDWLVTWTTNSFEDRDREIFSQKSIEDYVGRHEDEAVKGTFRLWHLPGTDFGDIRWQAVEGRFLVEAGPFHDTPTGHAVKAFLAQHPDGHPAYAPHGWGASHGYHYECKDREDGVYEWFDKVETSILPAHAAANPYNPGFRLGSKEVVMNDKQKALLADIGGPDLVDLVEQTSQDRTKELEDAGIARKEVTPEPAPPEAVLETAPDDSAGVEVTGPDVGELVKAVADTLRLPDLSDVIAAQGEALSALAGAVTALRGEVKALHDTTVEVKQAQEEEDLHGGLPRYSWFQASKAIETVMTQDDGLKGAAPKHLPRAMQHIIERVGG